MESFVWTTLWAILEHKSRDRAAGPDMVWQKRLNAGANADDIANVIRDAQLGMLDNPEFERPSMVYYYATMLERVHTALAPIRHQWNRDSVLTALIPQAADLRNGQYMLLFHQYAYWGVSAVVSAMEYRTDDDVAFIEGMLDDLSA